MRKESIDKINKENLIIGEKGDIQYKCNSENISSEYNVSGIGGYGLNLI